MALITCENAAFAYDGHVVISDVSFTVERGEFLCIVGENGSGKSTLVKGLLGLIQPCRGSVRVGDGLTRAQIGYLPQQTDLQRDFPASVREVVRSGVRGRGLFLRREDKARAAEAMRLMGISDKQKRCYMELSGGQQQRVLLARALCATETLLLLDEPVAGLDPLVTRELYELIETLNRERGVTVVMISHDIATSARYATHILHLQKTPVFFGSAEDYLASPLGRAFRGTDEREGAKV